MENEKTIKELIDSINNSIKEIRENPTQVERVPSNFEIIVGGLIDSKSIETLFSPKIDTLINTLFKLISDGDYEKILKNEDIMREISDSIFGKGSFQGPISRSVLSNIQASVESEKYQTMKSNLGKSLIAIKKKNLILKNLKKGSKMYDKRSEEYKKYNEAVYAIKSVIKFVEKIYRSRSLINKKVCKGLDNIIHEEIMITF